MAPTFTFGPSAAETVANELGLEVEDETERLRDAETKEYETPAGSDEPITIDEFAGCAVGSRVLIKEDFNSISSYVEDYRDD